MAVRTRREKSNFIVELDNPPVNAIGLAVRKGLHQALEKLKRHKDVSRVILIGKGDVFAAGGDLKEFDLPPVAPHLPDLIAQIEASEVPWIAVINGTALGAGCELILGCSYRIAVPNCQVGFPEVTFGVVPGCGGTQRLPRLIGIEDAIALISQGKPISSGKALAIGLIDMISEDPLATAIKLSDSTILNAKNICQMPSPRVTHGVIKVSGKNASRNSNLVAPKKAIELVLKSADLPLAEGLKLEREKFFELRSNEQARSLRHVIFAERKANSVQIPILDTESSDHVAVIGGGAMGSGIGYALLSAGYRVTVIESDSASSERASSNLLKLIDAGIKREYITQSDGLNYRARLRTSSDYAEIADASVAIEAVFEDMQVKKSVFAMMETSVADSAILASNTSYLDLNEIAGVMEDPSRVVGLHFFAPAHIMKLLEIVRGDATSQRALAAGFAIARRLRKVPVLAGVCDGFIGNRILSRYREAADSLLLDGALPWEVDQAMVNFGYPMGPYEAQDLSGLDIAYANRRRQDAARDPDRRYVSIADKMVENDRLGRKSGLGWYQYSASGQKQIDGRVEALILQESRREGVSRVEYSPNEIQQRLLSAMINEAADILQEGIAQSAADVDLVTIFGYGFPRWRGGLMHYADYVGIGNILTKLENLQEEDFVAWKPSQVLYQCVAENLNISDYRR